MRKLLIIFFAVIVTMSILWIVAGEQVSEFVDRFRTAQLQSTAVHQIAYEGSGDGGILILDGKRLNLSPLNPHVGSTKENQLALAYAGTVFPFGALQASDVDKAVGNVPEQDITSFETRASCISWPSVGSSGLHLNQNNYYRLLWQKPGGMKLEMSWNVRRPQGATSLIRVEISDASR